MQLATIVPAALPRLLSIRARRAASQIVYHYPVMPNALFVLKVIPVFQLVKALTRWSVWLAIIARRAPAMVKISLVLLVPIHLLWPYTTWTSVLHVLQATIALEVIAQFQEHVRLVITAQSILLLLRIIPVLPGDILVPHRLKRRMSVPSRTLGIMPSVVVLLKWRVQPVNILGCQEPKTTTTVLVRQLIARNVRRVTTALLEVLP